MHLLFVILKVVVVIVSREWRCGSLIHLPTAFLNLFFGHGDLGRFEGGCSNEFLRRYPCISKTVFEEAVR